MPDVVAISSDAVRARPTLRDVALLAGVSPKTVSRVVNGEAGVSAPKTAAVQRAIAQLDYRPNFTASSLRRVAADLIFRRLDGEQWRPTTHLVPTRLIARGSGEIRGPHSG
jgi:DNA-binding LacI/PurR family transcriptional regulator